MHAIGRRLGQLDLDVIAFQEVWQSDSREILEAAGLRAGLPHRWHSGAPLGGSGLLVLSRFPIEEARFERFALRGLARRIDHGDYWGGKGFVQLRLATDVGPLTFIDTHLHARYSRDVAHQYRGHRVGQIVQIAMASLETTDPVIVAGDFNVAEGQPEYQVFTGLTGMRDVAVELDRRDATVLRSNPFRGGGHKPDRRKDYFFVRDGSEREVRPRQVERGFDEVFELEGQAASYSNHAAVIAEFEIGSARQSPVHILDREAIEIASRMLSEGRARAEHRQRGDRLYAGAGLAAAALATVGVRAQGITRRRLLRGTLQGAALAALTPGVGFSILSEVFVPDELRAFDALAARLAQIDPSTDHLLA